MSSDQPSERVTGTQARADHDAYCRACDDAARQLVTAVVAAVRGPLEARTIDLLLRTGGVEHHNSIFPPGSFVADGPVPDPGAPPKTDDRIIALQNAVRELRTDLSTLEGQVGAPPEDRLAGTIESRLRDLSRSHRSLSERVMAKQKPSLRDLMFYFAMGGAWVGGVAMVMYAVGVFS